MARSGHRPLEAVEGGKRDIPVLEELDRFIAESAPDDKAALVVQLAARLARLGAELTTPPHREASDNASDRNISVREAAERLGVSSHWLYKNADTLPFLSRLGRRVVCSAGGLERFQRRRTGINGTR